MANVLIRDPQGKVTGHLDTESGEFRSVDGRTVTQMESLHDHNEALSDYAGRLMAQNTARQIGGPVRMVDRDGEEQWITQRDLAQSDVHIDAALPNYAAGYKLADGVADVAMPVVLVPKASDKFNTWDAANAFRRVLPVGGSSGGQIVEVNPTLSNSTYSTVEYALGAFVPQNVVANADAPLQPFQAAVKRIMNALILEREIRVQALLRTTGSWDSSLVTALSGTTIWNGGSASDPVKNLHTLIEASAMPVTGIVMSEQVEHDFVRNASVQKYIASKTSAAPVPDAMQASALLRLPPIYTARMKYFASGTTLSYVWGGDVVLLHTPPSNPPTDQEEVAHAYTFRWNGGDTPDGTMTAGMLIRTFFDPKRGLRGGTMVVCGHNDAEKMTSTIVGGLITGAHT